MATDQPHGPLLAEYLKGEQLARGRLARPTTGQAQLERLPLRCWLSGTGTPAVVDGRYGPSTVLSIGEDLVMVDTGNGCAYQLFRLGRRPEEVTHVLITHNHVDHNADLGFLILAPWIHRTQEKPPTVIGPPGTLEYVNRIFAAHDYDIRARLPHGYDPEGLSVPVIEVDDGLTLNFSGWQVSAVKVEHSPVEDAFGYVFRTAAHAVAISGDTRPSDSLIAAAQGVDVLIHEALFPGYGIPDYHTSVHDVGRVAKAANAALLVLTHLIPGHLPEEKWRDIVQRSFQGDLIVGTDLLQVCDLS
ncbi:MBL fold metallo-hydrolase [Pseudarthrobacter sp. NamE2]|uniref:MBL fold metallo-hydrolase n=1 Tax=Pseudarthrobacter sp. NamE2 TaxID=2576838 RepID=UPI0014858529|nr:MBL fold metallo-hydrolase [Pseudarthrobacter sp. NamE2]